MSADNKASAAGARQLPMLRAYIKNNDLLGKLSPEHQERLAGASRLRQLDEGETIFRQGELGSGFFALCRGTVKVFRMSPDGREAVVKILQPGEIFGEVVLFRPIPYPGTALCLSESALVEIDKERLLGMLDDPGFRIDFIGILMEKLQYLNQRVYMLGALDVEERFFHHIVSNYGIRGEYELGISKKELAAAIGTVPETLSRLLGRLGSRGILSWNGERFSIRADVLDATVDELRQAGFLS